MTGVVLIRSDSSDWVEGSTNTSLLLLKYSSRARSDDIGVLANVSTSDSLTVPIAARCFNIRPLIAR